MGCGLEGVAERNLLASYLEIDQPSEAQARGVLVSTAIGGGAWGTDRVTAALAHVRAVSGDGQSCLSAALATSLSLTLSLALSRSIHLQARAFAALKVLACLRETLWGVTAELSGSSALGADEAASYADLNYAKFMRARAALGP